jgi:MoaA/NifB/PqqE/SkfB family radical SAM enzyme
MIIRILRNIVGKAMKKLLVPPVGDPDKLLVCAISLTSRCNCRCKHCLRDLGQKDLPFETFKKIVLGIKKYGVQMFALSGGEIFLYPHIKEVFAFFEKHNLRFSFVSNGHFISEFASTLKKYRPLIRTVKLSLDSHKPELNDEIRGEGSFAKVLEAINVLNSLGIPVGVAHCISKKNYKYFDDFVEFAKGLKVTELDFGTIVPSPSAVKNDMVLSKEQRQAIVSRIFAAKRLSDMDIYSTAELKTSPEIKLCTAMSMKSFSFDEDGYITPCCALNSFASDKRKTRILSAKDHSIEECVEAFEKEIHEFTMKRITDFKKEDTEDIDFCSCFYCYNRL